MNELALFTGGGGGVLGSILNGHRIVCGVEIEPYCREILLRRQEEGHLPPFLIWDDIRTFRLDNPECRDVIESLRRIPDPEGLLVSGGFPCQPFSTAGRRKGEADDRNLWPECIRIICEVRPSIAWLENVPGLLSVRGGDNRSYYGRILGDLAEGGYDCRWDCIPASAVGAPHRRDRLWIVAYPANNNRRSRERGKETGVRANRERGRRSAGGGEDVADTGGTGRAERKGEPGNDGQECAAIERGRCEWWDIDPADGSAQPRLGRVAHGVANRVDRLKAIGNGQVPEVVRVAWELLTGGE